MFYPLIITFFIVNVVTTALLIIILYNKTRCADKCFKMQKDIGFEYKVQTGFV